MPSAKRQRTELASFSFRKRAPAKQDGSPTSFTHEKSSYGRFWQLPYLLWGDLITYRSSSPGSFFYFFMSTDILYRSIISTSYLLISCHNQRRPISPSASSSLRCWKLFTAFSVAGPNSPSGVSLPATILPPQA